MKKSFTILAGGIVFAFALNSCNKANPAEQAAKDELKVDSLVNKRLSTLRTSLLADFNKTTLVLAATRADSIESAMKEGEKKAEPKKKASAPKKEEPKKAANATDSKMSGNANQTSAQKTDNKMNGNAQQNSGQKTDDKMNRLKNKQQQPPK